MNDVFERSVTRGCLDYFLSLVKGGPFIEELELDVCSLIQFMFVIESDGLGGDIPETSSK